MNKTRFVEVFGRAGRERKEILEIASEKGFAVTSREQTQFLNSNILVAKSSNSKACEGTSKNDVRKILGLIP